MKKCLAALLALVMVLGLCACGATEEAPAAEAPAAEAPAAEAPAAEAPAAEAPAAKEAGDRDLTITYIHSNAAIQCSISTEIGIMDYCEKNGFNWKFDIQDAKGDSSNLPTMIENAVAKGVDGIIIDYADLRSVASSLKIAYDAGVPVVTIDAGGYVPYTVCDVTSNNYEGAAKNMMYVLGELGTTANVLMFDLDISAGCRQRCEVYKAVLNENAGINLLEYYNVDVTNIQPDTMAAMETFIQKYGVGGENGINAVLCAWDECGYAVALSLTQAGYDVDDCVIISQDGHWDVALSYLKNDPTWPLISTVVQKFDTLGKVAADVLYKINCMGMTFDEAVDGQKTIVVTSPLVTKDNIDKVTTIETELGTIPDYCEDYFYGPVHEVSSYKFAK